MTVEPVTWPPAVDRSRWGYGAIAITGQLATEILTGVIADGDSPTIRRYRVVENGLPRDAHFERFEFRGNDPTVVWLVFRSVTLPEAAITDVDAPVLENHVEPWVAAEPE